MFYQTSSSWTSSYIQNQTSSYLTPRECPQWSPIHCFNNRLPFVIFSSLYFVDLNCSCNHLMSLSNRCQLKLPQDPTCHMSLVTISDRWHWHVPLFSFAGVNIWQVSSAYVALWNPGIVTRGSSKCFSQLGCSSKEDNLLYPKCICIGQLGLKWKMYVTVHCV